MKNTLFLTFPFKLALLYWIAIAPCEGIHAQSATQPALQTEIRFRTVHDSLMIVSVMANGDGPFDFLFDTGAQTTVVDPRVASRIALTVQSQIRQTTLTGTQTVPISAPAMLALGPAKVAGLHVLIQNLNSLHGIDDKIVGILGQDFLFNFNYLIDYRVRTVRFDKADAILDRVSGDHVPFEGGRKRMMITAQAFARSAGHATLRLLLDSGATSMVLMGWESNQLEPLVQGMALKIALETTSSGQASVRTGEVHTLEIGSEQFHEIPAALAAHPNTELAEDGLVPLAIFRSIYVNNRDSFVILSPQVRKD